MSIEIGDYSLDGLRLTGPCNCNSLDYSFWGRECKSHEYLLSPDEIKRLRIFVLEKPFLTGQEKSEKIKNMMYGREPEVQRL